MGAKSASPQPTAATAASSRSGPESLSRKPDAPARSAPYTYSSRSNVVSTRTRGAGSAACSRIFAVAVMPFMPGILMSIKMTSGRAARGERHGFLAVARLADDLDARRGAQQPHQPRADEELVVDDEHPDRCRRPVVRPSGHSVVSSPRAAARAEVGRVRRTANPPSLSGPMLIAPP